MSYTHADLEAAYDELGRLMRQVAGDQRRGTDGLTDLEIQEAAAREAKLANDSEFLWAMATEFSDQWRDGSGRVGTLAEINAQDPPTKENP